MPVELPVLLLAFADGRSHVQAPLRHLAEEQRQIMRAFESLDGPPTFETLTEPYATQARVFDHLLGNRYGDRIAVFHFAGHAGDGALVFETRDGAPSRAAARGLAQILGRQRRLRLVFLNGCATHDQAQALLDAGVETVIVTSQAIEDAVAAELSARFYAGLAAGRPIRRAFEDATAVFVARSDDLPRQGYRSFVPPGDDLGPWPWRLLPDDGGDWSLLDAETDEAEVAEQLAEARQALRDALAEEALGGPFGHTRTRRAVRAAAQEIEALLGRGDREEDEE